MLFVKYWYAWYHDHNTTHCHHDNTITPSQHYMSHIASLESSSPSSPSLSPSLSPQSPSPYHHHHYIPHIPHHHPLFTQLSWQVLGTLFHNHQPHQSHR